MITRWVSNRYARAVNRPSSRFSETQKKTRLFTSR